MRSSHSLDRLDMAFDDDRLVPDAGLILPATLAHHLGLSELVDEHLDLGAAPGRANVGDKLLTLVMSALAGGDHIDHANALRAGDTGRSWASGSRPPPRWARSCAASAGATCASSTGSAGSCSPGPGRRVPDPAPTPLTIDLDSTICETYGLAKEGAVHHATPTSAATTRCSRSPRAPATCSWPACARATPTAAAAPATSCARRSAGSATPGPPGRSRCAPTPASTPSRRRRVPAGSRSASPSPPAHRSSAALIEAIPEEAWTPIPYWIDGGADVAETDYTPFAAEGRRPGAAHRAPGATHAGLPAGPVHDSTTTTPSSPTGTATRSSSRPTTAAMPRSRTPSGTSRRGSGSTTCRRAGSPPTAPGWRSR